MVKLIALDLDGTLLDPSGAVTSATKEAIAQARAAGVRVVLNTGRPIPEACHFAAEAGCDTYLSCLGGAAIADHGTGRTLRRQDIPEPWGTKALELCLGREIELMIFAEENILVDRFSGASLRRTYPFPVFHENALELDNPLAYMREKGIRLTKIHGDWNPGNYPLKELAAIPGVELTSASDHDFELVPEGVNKGRALETLAELYGCGLQECAAVGDSDNDLAMLRAAGLSIAMGNGSQAVKAAAAWITDSNDRDGVAKAILRCLEEA